MTALIQAQQHAREHDHEHEPFPSLRGNDDPSGGLMPRG